MIEYDIHQRHTFTVSALASADKVQNVASIIEHAIRSIMGHKHLIGYSPKWPLNEMGMDSLDLLELRALLTKRFNTPLDPGFFFQYSTPKAITEYFYRTQSPAPTPQPDLQSSPQKNQLDLNDSIAIIGIACRLPGGVYNPDHYWSLLKDGVDAITSVPPNRWDSHHYYHPTPGKPGKIITHAGGFIDAVEQFDAAFFRISPREAASLDPQQRLLLELNWEALENAGLSPSSLEGTSTGIFVGLFSHDYATLQIKQNAATDYDTYFATGNAPSIAAGRLAYFFDFKGPALTVDTACSSSLVAIHLACQSLLRGECQLALVSAVNLLLSPELSIAFSSAGMLAPDGRCKTFDAAADGYVRSEGCAVTVLKPLSQALADGDNVLAIIRGSAINQDGMSNGLTAPNGLAQQTVIRQALGQLSPADITYIEAHGTGTALGDPIEIKALEAVYSQGRTKDNPLFIGSAKTHIGHTEAVAGLASLLKVVLSLQHHTIPAHLHLKTLNPHIVLDTIPAQIPLQNTPWYGHHGRPRLAGISAFGFSGTNAHLIVQEAPPIPPRLPRPPQSHYLFTLSAKSIPALRQLATAYTDYLDAHPAIDLGDLCYTAYTGRAHFTHRLAVVTNSITSLRTALSNFAQSTQLEQESTAAAPWIYGKCADISNTAPADTSPNIAQALQNTVADHCTVQKAASALQNAEVHQNSAISSQDRTDRLHTYAKRYISNSTFHWSDIEQQGPWRRLSLPTYPFQRRAYWLPSRISEPPQKTTVAGDHTVLVFEETWQAQALTTLATTPINTLLCILAQSETQPLITQQLKRLSPNTQTLFLSPYQDLDSFTAQLSALSTLDAILYLPALERPAIPADYTHISTLIRALSRSAHTTTRVLLAAQIAENPARCYAESWIGFQRSLRLILPKLSLTAVYLADSNNLADCLALLWQELRAAKLETSCYQAQQRHILRAQELQLQPTASNLLKPHGIYLITGGCGGLGTILAEHLARHYQARLILSGRSALQSPQRALLTKLQQLGSPEAVYLQADVTDETAMRQGLAAIVRQHSQFATLNGLFHAAGVEIPAGNLLDNDPAHFDSVLQAKIAGTLVLDSLFPEGTLDFVCYFSSAAAVLGDLGTCDYAVANRFLMAFSAHKQRTGSPTPHYAILWPLWQDGGMSIGSAENTRLYLQSSGLRALQTAEGITLLESLLATQAPRQPLLLAGNPARIRHTLSAEANPAKQFTSQPQVLLPTSTSRPELHGLTLAECLEYDLKQHITTRLGIPSHELESTQNLAEFGFDSITLAEFASALSAYYGTDITPSVFFGYSTITALVTYFQTQHSQIVQHFYQPHLGAQLTATPPAFQVPSAFYDNQAPPSSSSVETPHPEPIAIIGMSGRFPGARNLTEFWHILLNAQEVITDIPPERFDWRAQYPDTADKLPWRCGLIPGVDEFDPLFFEISPREAQTMDPRQRLLLQEAWNALEDAGYGPLQIQAQKMGMFVGVERGDFVAQGEKRLTSEHEGILAARLAYFLNFKGPVMAINTACSSGLVAAHQACQALLNRECDTAIAAAVNLMLSAKVYLSAAEAGMLSPSGHCFAFDQRADGMTPGEAVVALVFKRLSDAQRDQDPIYAVIQGSGINYDGKTNGLTVPNGLAQIELLRTVYSQYHLNPAQISYVVTYGTATKLGDPVEINALYETFKGYTDKIGYCALTSSKTNFGHTFAASGLLSLVNLVLAEQHGQIPASLHGEQENPYINWKDSPFYINKQTRPWTDQLRWGAVSAFGMSGTNAHLVVTGYTANQNLVSAAGFHLLLLSAITETALATKLSDLHQFLQRSVSPVHYPQLAMTLSERREHFQYRCALLVQNTADALLLLQQSPSEGQSARRFIGQVPSDFIPQSVLRQQIKLLLPQVHQASQDPAHQRDILSALAQLYCQGYDIPLSQAYGLTQPQALHAPTYPFTKHHYPIDSNALSPATTADIPNPSCRLHPLLHQNTSTFKEQRFTSTFHGQEFYLVEHQVQGHKIFPGVAYLEMVRAAIAQAMDTADSSILIKQVTWSQPLVFANKIIKASIRLSPISNTQFKYEIYSENSGQSYPHSQGLVQLHNLPEVSRDIAVLQSQQAIELDTSACYTHFAQLGFQYGPRFRGIQTVSITPEYILAKLHLPDYGQIDPDFVLHPGLLDAALQTTAIFLKHHSQAPSGLPFSVESVFIFSPCSTDMWAIATPSQTASSVQKFDIDLCHQDGRVCVRFSGFATRPFSTGMTELPTLPAHGPTTGTILLQPVMQPLATPPTSATAPEGMTVLAVGHARLTAQFTAQYPHSHTLTLQAEDTLDSIRLKLESYGELEHIVWFGSFLTAAQLQEDSVISSTLLLLKFIKTLLLLGYDGKSLYWTLAISAVHDSAVQGLMGSLAKEYPQWKIRLLDFESESDFEVSSLLKLPFDALGDPAYYRQQRWHKLYLHPAVNLDHTESLYKQGGVYLVIGGAGGIGEVWSQYMINHYQARIIWLGRRLENPDIADKIQRLGSNFIHYISADISDLTALQTAYAQIKQHHARINGIVHSALVLADKSLMNMTEAVFSAALLPKITGSINLVKVFGQEPLDFWLFFSAMQSFSKAAGQSNYAAGCCFADAFARQLAQTYPIKIMNWGYWGSVGIVASESYREQMAKYGLGSIEPEEAMAALETLMTTSVTQLAFIKTTSPQHLFSPHIVGVSAEPLLPETYIPPLATPVENAPVVSESPAEDVQLKDQTRAYLRSVLAAGLALPIDQLDARTDFERYGLDSILVVQLTHRLREVFPDVNTTLLFEYRTLEALTHYFLENARPILLKLLGTAQTVQSSQPAASMLPVTQSPTVPSLHTQHRFFSTDSWASRDLAIIGLAGKYAQAENLSAFWKNLSAGKNCISEIPRDRWDWQQHPDIYTRWGGFIADIDQFDPLFFNISPREAETMDPQERLFLQVAHACIEDAGYAPLSLGNARKVGVFVGVMNNNYPGGARHWSIANRVSYHLNLHGPSMAIDTACSSSLTAIYVAMESLRKGDCDYAIAGGVNLIITPEHYQRLTAVGMLSHDDRNKTFGAGADGFVDGEGVGAVLLKPLDKAREEGDSIYAVIKGGAINAGGKTSGYTVPNPKAQAEVISQALKDAGVEPRSLSYIEAHGTGTSLGDPIEIGALTKAFAEYTHDTQFCAIGSVKSNIGHCESAAGIAGLTKVILQLQREQLVPSLHAERLNPELNFANTPFRIQHTLSAWSQQGQIRRAGISSFGAGGANAHLVIEEYPKQPYISNSALPLFVLSAKDSHRLQAYARSFLDYLQVNTPDLQDLLYTLQVGREGLEERLGFQAQSLEDIRRKLQDFLEGRTESGCYQGNRNFYKNTLTLFEADEDWQSLVNAWLAGGKYHKVLEIWVKGVFLDWESLYTVSPRPQRISLPTYPFAKERYWFQTQPGIGYSTPLHASSTINTRLLSQHFVSQDTTAVAKYVEESSSLDNLLYSLLQVQLHDVEDSSIISQYHPWLHTTRTLFSKPAETLNTGDKTPWQIWESYKLNPASAEMQARILLAEAMLRALPDILTGKIPATDVMFPRSSMTRVEAIYKNNALADYFNHIIADGVAAYLEMRQQQDPAVKIRVFEIGAGTGGTSAIIFKRLSSAQKQHIQEYCYTDLSKAFLMHAETHYGRDNPFLRYQIFNASLSVEQQTGIEASAYDLVIATNVLHATSNIRQTLHNAQALLKPGGLILLHELAQNSLFLHLTFGLLEGWWLFEDPELRIEGSPAIAPETWRQLLTELKFSNIIFPAKEQHVYGLQIIIAENSTGPVLRPDLRAAPVLTTPFSTQIDPESAIQQIVRDQLSNALKIEPERIDPDLSFSDYGVDSITGVSFVAQLNQALALTLDTTVIFDYASVNRLTAHILHTYPETPMRAASAFCNANAASWTVQRSATVSYNANACSAYATSTVNSPIAIIGMSGRFPQSESLNVLWQHLANGDDLVSPITRWEFSEESSHCRDGGFLQDLDQFDALFFNISGSEATHMDPQQRLFLQEAWKALEDAGYAGHRIEGQRCGVYVGCAQGDYRQLLPKDKPAQAFWGNLGSIIPARIAYFLDLQGPAIAVDTACSSSLVAIHLACQGLWQGDCELALAGGVFLNITPELYELANEAGMLSPTGRCHSFDGRADGFAPGEGVGVLMLKPLAAALADGDSIHGVIRGIGVNQDGTTNGITAPSGRAQERLEREIYDRFHINPEQITLVEAHGTGTILGDPIEFTALKKAFRHYTEKLQYCALGSIKTNIGHAQLAAGVAGVIKYSIIAAVAFILYHTVRYCGKI